MRLAVIAGALAGGVTLSQFPEFSQQYLQRLAGRVEGLSQVVADFDASAAAADKTRAEALAELSGSTFLDRRQGDMARTFADYERLGADLAALRSAAAFGQMAEFWRFHDGQTLRGAWADFRPAVPVTAEGLAAGGAGAAGGAALVLGLLGLLRLRRTRRAA